VNESFHRFGTGYDYSHTARSLPIASISGISQIYSSPGLAWNKLTNTALMLPMLSRVSHTGVKLLRIASLVAIKFCHRTQSCSEDRNFCWLSLIILFAYLSTSRTWISVTASLKLHQAGLTKWRKLYVCACPLILRELACLMSDQLVVNCSISSAQ
jgi:hypothetical protein